MNLRTPKSESVFFHMNTKKITRWNSKSPTFAVFCHFCTFLISTLFIYRISWTSVHELEVHELPFIYIRTEVHEPKFMNPSPRDHFPRLQSHRFIISVLDVYKSTKSAPIWLTCKLTFLLFISFNTCQIRPQNYLRKRLAHLARRFLFFNCSTTHRSFRLSFTSIVIAFNFITRGAGSSKVCARWKNAP